MRNIAVFSLAMSPFEARTVTMLVNWRLNHEVNCNERFSSKVWNELRVQLKSVWKQKSGVGPKLVSYVIIYNRSFTFHISFLWPSGFV